MTVTRPDNLTAVLYKAHDLRLENLPVPEPKENEVLLEMACVGICGSDVHYLEHGRIADYVVKQPMIIGHEASGTVLKLGNNVNTLQVGDRVAIEPGVTCRACEFCKGGRYNLCPDVVFCATPPYHGNLARYYTHAADFCHKIPDNVSMEEAALLEPLSVGVHACRMAGVTLGSRVLIMGAGTIGLVTLIAAKAMGASKVVVSGVTPHRQVTAKVFGADFTVLMDKNKSEKQLAKKIHDFLGDYPDKTIDCSGFQTTIKLGIEVTKRGGTYVLVGFAEQDVNIPLCNAAMKEVDIRGVFRYANDYPIALAMVASGKVDVKKLITHNYPLHESVDAFETARTGTGNPIKVMIHCKKEKGNAGVTKKQGTTALN